MRRVRSTAALKLLLGWHAGLAGEIYRFLGVVQRVIHFKHALMVLDVQRVCPCSHQ